MPAELTPRERLLRFLRHEPLDRVPIWLLFPYHRVSCYVDVRPRLVIAVPVLTPRLSSLWVHLITPLHARIARPLAEGLRNPVVCRNDEAQRLMPHQCLTIREAMDAAVALPLPRSVTPPPPPSSRRAPRAAPR